MDLKMLKRANSKRMLERVVLRGGALRNDLARGKRKSAAGKAQSAAAEGQWSDGGTDVATPTSVSAAETPLGGDTPLVTDDLVRRIGLGEEEEDEELNVKVLKDWLCQDVQVRCYHRPSAGGE